MSFKNYRDESRTNLGTSDEGLSLEQINCGAILRIADATEKMASNYTRMENELGMYKRWNDEKNKRINKLERSNAALRGHIKRAKNKNT